RASWATIRRSHGRNGFSSRNRPSARHAFSTASCAASSASAALPVMTYASLKAVSWLARTSSPKACASPRTARSSSSRSAAWLRGSVEPTPCGRPSTPLLHRPPERGSRVSALAECPRAAVADGPRDLRRVVALLDQLLLQLPLGRHAQEEPRESAEGDGAALGHHHDPGEVL